MRKSLQGGKGNGGKETTQNMPKTADDADGNMGQTKDGTKRQLETKAEKRN